jgi:hypothetical protein
MLNEKSELIVILSEAKDLHLDLGVIRSFASLRMTNAFYIELSTFNIQHFHTDIQH